MAELLRMVSDCPVSVKSKSALAYLLRAYSINVDLVMTTMRHWMRVLLWAICTSVLLHGVLLDWLRRPRLVAPAGPQPFQLRITSAAEQAGAPASAPPGRPGRDLPVVRSQVLQPAQALASSVMTGRAQAAASEAQSTGAALALPAVSVLRSGSPAEARVALRLALAAALQRLPSSAWPAASALVWCDYDAEGRLLLVRSEQATYPDLVADLRAVVVPAALSGQAFALDLLIER
jgi:hypothetical protein